MNRNVSIIVVILVLVVIAGYLVWIRSKYQPPVSPQTSPITTVIPTTSPEPSATPLASPGIKEATGSMKDKSSTSSSSKK